MKPTEQQIRAAMECIKSSLQLIAEGKVEDVIRHNFSSYLRQIFPDIPGWLERHIAGGEAAVKFAKEGATRTGFVDNLVDLTPIEYESDLTNRTKFVTGYGQVQDYSASLLNKRHDPELIIGILSDTVRWRAYRISLVTQPAAGIFGREHIELEEIEQIDLSSADGVAALRLISFLSRYLGRIESRPLNADSIAKDLGFESAFCGRHIETLRNVVQTAFETRPDYAKLIGELWTRFVNYVRDRAKKATFDPNEYTDELYIVTLAKLVIANVIQGRALLSDDAEMRSILRGEFFKNKGLLNLVEYDYFGWLNEGSALEHLLPAAKAIQEDLQAYNFSRIPSEDLFGRMMAQLAKRSQRLLLGQEWTPNWLARLIADAVLDKLPEGEQPELVDMCCGSGTMIVEVVKILKEDADESLPKARRLTTLTQAITGFDIDPLAVLLSKISWIIAARDWLEPWGDWTITIPVYHADSLFAITPLSNNIEDEQGNGSYTLRIADVEIQLPRFLVSPEFQPAFDAMLDFGYDVAMSAGNETVALDETMLEDAMGGFLDNSSTVTPEQRGAAKTFLLTLTITVNRLNREGRNGIWIFILRNSYRPGLVAGQFNGLISNPPWLALSKIGDNPYQAVLDRKAAQFGIQPPGPSFLHVELSTIFLLHAVDRYLKSDAIVGCITPDSVLNGYHHNPFRAAEYGTAPRPVPFAVDEIWRVQENTFKNRAIVLFGTKEKRESGEPNPIPGHLAEESGLSPLTFYRNVLGRRTAWSEQDLGHNEALFKPASFRQGADIMPRTLFFHEVTDAASSMSNRQRRVEPIDVGSSHVGFVIKDAKNFKTFRLQPCVLPDELFFDVMTSNLLTPFEIGAPLVALLPIQKGIRIWRLLDGTAIATKGAAAVSAFNQMSSALGPTANVRTLWERINTRNKLEQQVIEAGGYVVFAGTSGALVCAAFAATDSFDINKLIVDQTLNWAKVQNKSEAIYLTGALNSEAINQVIEGFQPEGLFGKRHIHSLPFGITPPFDASQFIHQEVVVQTRRLLDDYEEAKMNDTELSAMLDPNRSSLGRRRSVIKAKLKELPAYEGYSEACRVLYGV